MGILFWSKKVNLMNLFKIDSHPLLPANGIRIGAVFFSGCILFAAEVFTVHHRNLSAAPVGFSSEVHIASPAIITGGRNIAFERGTILSKAPGTYLNLLECCQSDEAIKSRIALGGINCHLERMHH